MQFVIHQSRLYLTRHAENLAAVIIICTVTHNSSNLIRGRIIQLSYCICENCKLLIRIQYLFQKLLYLKDKHV